MPALAVLLVSSPDIQERIVMEIPEDLVSDIRSSLSSGGSGSQRFLFRLTKVARVLEMQLEGHPAKDQGDALK